MLPQVRCFTCGNIFTKSVFDKWISETNKGTERKKILDNLGLFNLCCRMTMIGQINIADKLPYTIPKKY